MILVIDLALFALALPLAVITFYQAVITGAAFSFNARRDPGADPMRLAVVVPAHNEETEIAATVAGILASDYPRDKYQVYVLADNCTDGTADAARDAGAGVIERTDPNNRGKGQALAWLFGAQLDTLGEAEAIVLVDADTEVAPGFLKEIAASLQADGVQAVQGLYRVKNPEENWRTALTYAGFAVVNHLRPMGRNQLGGTADLKGNGMALRMDLVRTHGYPAQATAVEDTECALMLLLAGHRVCFNPDAGVRSEMPATQGQAESQRRRWESGRAILLRMFAGRLFGRFMADGQVRFLDALLDLATPPITLLAAAELAGLAVAAFTRTFWLATFFTFVLLTGLQVAAALYLSKAPAKVWTNLAAAPLFMAWKIPLYIRLMIQGPPTTWERTERRGEQDRTPPDA